ncbi:hypothetical protein E4K43_00370, partial [Neisseria meningitidis]|nr:hypothetical protein [Neisseria meningitidis]
MNDLAATDNTSSNKSDDLVASAIQTANKSLQYTVDYIRPMLWYSRLMGFPKDFVIDAVSKTAAYKQFGNSIAVPLV